MFGHPCLIPSNISLLPSLSPVLFPILSSHPQPDALSYPLLTHAAASIINATPQPLVPSSSVFTGRPHRVPYHHTAGLHSSPLRSVSVAVTHLLSSAEPCHLASPHFQVVNCLDVRLQASFNIGSLTGGGDLEFQQTDHRFAM